MNPILRNVLAVVAGFVVGSIVNMGIVMGSGAVVPPPPGVDVNDMESLKAGMHLFQPVHFIGPFLAHALGTLAGAFTVARLAGSRPFALAMTIAVLFLCGGISAVLMLGGPVWFSALDLIGAYLPMGWLGWKLSGRAR